MDFNVVNPQVKLEIANSEIAESLKSVPRQHAQMKWFVQLYLVMVFGLLTYAGFFASRLEATKASQSKQEMSIIGLSDNTTQASSPDLSAASQAAASATKPKNLDPKTDSPRRQNERPAVGNVCAAIVGVAFGLLVFGLGMALLSVLGRRISTLYLTYRHLAQWRAMRLTVGGCGDIKGVFAIDPRDVKVSDLVFTVPVVLLITNVTVLLGSAIYFIGPVAGPFVVLQAVATWIALTILISPRVWTRFEIPLHVVRYANTMLEAERWEKKYLEWMKGSMKKSVRKRERVFEDILVGFFIIALIFGILFSLYEIPLCGWFGLVLCSVITLGRLLLIGVRRRRGARFKGHLKRATERRDQNALGRKNIIRFLSK